MADNLIDRDVYEDLKISLGDDYILELLETWYEESPKIFSEMETALANTNAENFRRSAHSMKSNAASFGAMHLAALCKELEDLGRQEQLGLVGGKLVEVKSVYEKSVSELKALSYG